MKKILISVLCALSLSFANVYADEIEMPEVTDHEKVTIYLFRGQGCSHCYDALTYFNEIAKDYSDYFEIKTYEIWNNQYNYALLTDVLAVKEQEYEGVPYIIVGESYSKTGFMESWGTEIINAALTEYQNEKYVDVVAKTANDHQSAEVTSLREACVEEEIIVEERDSSADVYIIIGIFAVIILGGGALVYFSRKK